LINKKGFQSIILKTLQKIKKKKKKKALKSLKQSSSLSPLVIETFVFMQAVFDPLEKYPKSQKKNKIKK
jgi:hypothetical protein